MKTYFRLVMCCLALLTLVASAITVNGDPLVAPANFSVQEKGLGAEYQLSVTSNPETDRYKPAAAYDSARRRTLVVWHRNGGGNYYIEGRLLDAVGRPIGASPTILVSGATPVYQPTVVYDQNQGRYLIAWMRNSSLDGKTYEIWGKIVNYALGEVRPEYMMMAAPTNETLWSPRAAFNWVHTEYMVAVNSFDASPWPSLVPMAIKQRTMYDNGDLIDPLMTVIYNQAPDHLIYPQEVDIAFFPTGSAYGNYMWVWKQVKPGTADYDIWAASIDAFLGGVIPSLPPWKVDDSTYDQTSPRVATTGNDDFLVVWSERSPVGIHDWDIRGREMNQIGTFTGDVHIIAGAGSTDETNPFVTAWPGSLSRYAVGFEKESATGHGIWLGFYDNGASVLDLSGYRFWLDVFPAADFGFWDNYYPAGVAAGPRVQMAYQGISNTPGDHPHIYSRAWTPYLAFMPMVTRH